jgi:hypothetical protein
MAKPLKNNGDLLLVKDKSFLHGFALPANIKIKEKEVRIDLGQFL